jgi:hypothetical protein
MKISVIIVNFNSEVYLKKSILSIQNSHFNLNNLEIIVIDNASQNFHPKKFLKTFPNIKLLVNNQNKGFAGACNQGASIAKGEFVLFLNPDTIIGKNTLDYLYDYMKRNENVGISTCRLELPDGSLDDACHRGFPTLWNAFCHFTKLNRIFPKSLFFNGYHLGYQNMDKIHEIDSCVGAFLFIRRSIAVDIGWFDTDYFWYGEDIDICYRVKKMGYKIVYIPFVKTLHFKGVTSGLKKHKKNIKRDTKIIVINSRFDVMKIFYNKHYLKNHHPLIKFAVFFVIDIMKNINILKSRLI